MKINRWIALAMIALLVVGAMGFVSYRVFAQNNAQPAAQSGTEEPGQDSADETPPAQTGITATVFKIKVKTTIRVKSNPFQTMLTSLNGC